MLVHGRPFTEMLVSSLPDDSAAHTNPSFIRSRGDGPGSTAEAPSCRVSSARPCRRQNRTFTPVAAMHKYTARTTVRWAVTGSCYAANDAKSS